MQEYGDHFDGFWEGGGVGKMLHWITAVDIHIKLCSYNEDNDLVRNLKVESNFGLYLISC